MKLTATLDNPSCQLSETVLCRQRDSEAFGSALTAERSLISGFVYILNLGLKSSQ